MKDNKIDQDSEKTNLKKVFDDLYQYLKNKTSIYRSLSSTFMVVSITAVIFLISVGYPDLLDEQIIIGNISIKVISLSIAFLVLSFFTFLISTLLYLYKSIKVNSLYLYLDSELSLSERYEKIKKLTDFNREGSFFLSGIVTLVGAVIFMFLYFSAGGILMTTFLFSYLGSLILISYVSKKKKIRNIFKKIFRKIFKKKILKKNQE